MGLLDAFLLAQCIRGVCGEFFNAFIHAESAKDELIFQMAILSLGDIFVLFIFDIKFVQHYTHICITMRKIISTNESRNRNDHAKGKKHYRYGNTVPSSVTTGKIHKLTVYFHTVLCTFRRCRWTGGLAGVMFPIAFRDVFQIPSRKYLDIYVDRSENSRCSSRK